MTQWRKRTWGEGSFIRLSVDPLPGEHALAIAVIGAVLIILGWL